MMYQFLRHFLSSLLLLCAVLAGPALANVTLRVESKPAADPIQAFVRVTDNGGVPITSLNSAAFTVKVDAVNVPLQPTDLTPPSSEDLNQEVSVVFVMDYTSSVTDNYLLPLQTAVIEFINAMDVGDNVAIIKFNNSSGANVVVPFTEVSADNQALEDAVMAPYPGDGSNILDATKLGVEQFATATLPDGPKAVILVTDGIDTHSTGTSEDVIASANGNSIPIFTIGVGDPDQDALDLLGSLAIDTGGQFFPAPTEQAIADAYASVSLLLSSEYLITFQNDISDCAEHVFEVTVVGQANPASANFTRRTCDTDPDAFTFEAQTNVRPGDFVTSNEVTITGIEVPAHISVISGAYSIGCTSTFTLDPATIASGDTVCVRQEASGQPSTSKTTTLTIGGSAAIFTTTTRAASGGGGGGGGGGGSTGLFELLLGFSALLLRRRLVA